MSLPVMTTTSVGPKPFSWSWSKIKNYEACARRHHHVDVLKDFKEEESEQLKYGNTVHKIMEQRLRNGTELPPLHYAKLEPWAQWIESGQGALMVEQNLAIGKDLKPCEYFDKHRAWCRAKIDVLKVQGSAAVIIDWKTGKHKDDPGQLMINAAVVFSHHPNIQAIDSKFVWLDDNSISDMVVNRSHLAEIWRSLWPRVAAVENSHNTNDYPPTPSFLCERYCPVKTCEFHGTRGG